MRVFRYALIGLLIGYAFLGKGFAYLHVPMGMAVYVGEIALLLGILAVMVRPGFLRKALRCAPVYWYIAFALLGLLHTVPYLWDYGTSSLRDAALYYYGMFLVLVSCFAVERGDLVKAARLVSRVGLLLLIWAPWAMLATRYLSDYIPLVPGTTVPLLFVKSGDIAIHVTAAFVFMLVVPKRSWPHRHTVWTTILFLVALLPTLGSRTAVLTALAGCGLALLLKPSRQFLRLVAVVALCVFIAGSLDLSMGYGARDREISVRGVWAGMKSLLVSDYDSPYWDSFEGTKRWRVDWWRTIFEETVLGAYFWTGRGFGENLAVAHRVSGFEMELDDRPLRSPHNSHMTILARMGVPGAVLWILLNATWLRWLWRLRRRARTSKDTFLEGLSIWILCYWVMFMVNSATDVYLEGPQGGIWYWSVMGFGLAVARTHGRRTGTTLPSVMSDHLAAGPTKHAAHNGRILPRPLGDTPDRSGAGPTAVSALR